MYCGYCRKACMTMAAKAENVKKEGGVMEEDKSIFWRCEE